MTPDSAEDDMTSTLKRIPNEVAASPREGRHPVVAVGRRLLLVLTLILALVGTSGTSTVSASERPMTLPASGASDADRFADRTSGSVSSEYSYTVTEYLTWMTTELEGWWGNWFATNGFIAPSTAIYIVGPGQSGVTACGNATVTDTTNNAYYCPLDAEGRGAIWLPVTTFQQMWNSNVFGRSNGQPGDFAAAVIVAHEFGHHVQDELYRQWRDAGYDVKELTSDNKNLELIADCFAGSFTAGAYYKGILEPGDFEEAETALSLIGDTDPNHPRPHGSPTERVAAFKLGYNSADPMACERTYWR
jgi:predicted metalloprotease